jgi:peroxiredoxin
MHVACATLIALLVVSPAALGAEPAAKAPLRLGDSLAEVSLVNLKGKSAELSAYAGKTVVMIFLGSFSKTAPGVAKEVSKQLFPGLDSKTVLVFVHVEPIASAAKFRTDHKLAGESRVDPKGELLQKLGHRSVPACIILDRQSVLRHSEAGFSRAKLEVKIRQIGGEGSGA